MVRAIMIVLVIMTELMSMKMMGRGFMAMIAIMGQLSGMTNIIALTVSPRHRWMMTEPNRCSV